MDGRLFEIVLNKVQDFLKEKRIVIASEQTLMQALPLVIECVEMMKNKGVTGIEKRNLVLKVILFIVNQSKIDEEKKNLLRSLIEGGTLETTIDIIVDASKGKLELNRKTKRALFSCMRQCLDECSRHHTQPQTEVTPSSFGDENDPVPVFDSPEPEPEPETEKVTNSTMV
jgi:hypothetical protein